MCRATVADIDADEEIVPRDARLTDITRYQHDTIVQTVHVNCPQSRDKGDDQICSADLEDGQPVGTVVIRL